MRTQKILLLIAACYLAGFLAHAAILKKTVYGDGIFYYSWMRSVVVDHDVAFSDEYAHFHTGQPTTSLRLPGNKYSIGPALLWSPWFFWTHSVVRGSGYELPYQLVTGLTGVFYALIGLLLLFLVLNKYFDNTASLAAIIGIAGATNLLFYGSLDTVNSHAASFFASVLFLTFLFQKPKNWFAVGCALGLVGLMRTQDLVFGLLVLPFIKPKEIPVFASGVLLFFLPQLAAWQLLYGKFWVSPYVSNIEGFNFLKPQLLGVLFSPTDGLFLWTPMILIASAGFWIKNTRGLPMKFMGIIVLLELYIIASWSIWWQGASYSGRMFVSSLPFFAFGLANLFSSFKVFKLRHLILNWCIVLPLNLVNCCLIVYFLLSH